MPLRAYLDNVIVSGLIRGDVESSDPKQTEMNATLALYAAHNRRALDLVTSAEAYREQERTRDPKTRALLSAHRGTVPGVERDHEVLAFGQSSDQFGGSTTSPLVSDVLDRDLFDKLQSKGVHDSDAKHIVNAFVNARTRFVTTDRILLRDRATIEYVCPSLKIVRPSELAAELKL